MNKQDFEQQRFSKDMKAECKLRGEVVIGKVVSVDFYNNTIGIDVNCGEHCFYEIIYIHNIIRFI